MFCMTYLPWHILIKYRKASNTGSWVRGLSCCDVNEMTFHISDTHHICKQGITTAFCITYLPWHIFIKYRKASNTGSWVWGLSCCHVNEMTFHISDSHHICKQEIDLRSKKRQVVRIILSYLLTNIILQQNATVLYLFTKNLWTSTLTLMGVQWLDTEGLRVEALPASLCCVLEQDTFILV